MQIITGKYKSRKLEAVNSTSTRPTLARVKESIFNLIMNDVSDKVVLDLFAGSGAYGIECISRGAKQVYFVDSEALAIKTIQKNTRNMTEDFKIIKSNFADALSDFKKEQLKFDLVFLDPPYKSGYAATALKLLHKNDLLNENSLIVVEHEFENDLQNIDDCYIIKKSRKYGIAYVDILTYRG